MNNQEVAKKVVDRMLQEIQNGGQLPWMKPWATGRNSVEVVDGYTEIKMTPRFWNRQGKPYSGINPLLLAMSGKDGEWITFNQCKAEGGKVKKGAKASTVIFWSMLTKETDELDEDGNKIIKKIPLLKSYSVFHISDCEGIEQKHHPEPIIIKVPITHTEVIDPDNFDNEVNAAAEAVIAGYIDRCQTLKLYREDYSDRAFYSPALDSVTVPNIKQFPRCEEFYSTLFHELGHSTGHADRLNRFTGKAACATFGSQEYSKEELVAEITAASILNILGIESGNSFRNSAAYVQSWSEHIKNDPMMFVTASSRAEAAIDCILGVA